MRTQENIRVTVVGERRTCDRCKKTEILTGVYQAMGQPGTTQPMRAIGFETEGWWSMYFNGTTFDFCVSCFEHVLSVAEVEVETRK